MHLKSTDGAGRWIGELSGELPFGLRSDVGFW